MIKNVLFSSNSIKTGLKAINLSWHLWAVRGILKRVDILDRHNETFFRPVLTLASLMLPEGCNYRTYEENNMNKHFCHACCLGRSDYGQKTHA